jgi:5-dehydro-4-deoxyglucarate dehydratase
VTADPSTHRRRRAEALSARLREHLNAGVLGFPLSAFTPDGNGIELAGFRAHVRRHLDSGVGGLFVCCGTGEFPALTLEEYRQLVRAAVEEIDGRVPVIAGTGYGWPFAREFSAIAHAEGADGLLLLPHYLVAAPQEGLIANAAKVAEDTELPIILYQRGFVGYTESSLATLAAIPNVIGLKDGRSDFIGLQRMTLAVSSDFLFFNGALTAEIQYRPYASVGVVPYSSSVASCLPEIAVAFFAAARRDDQQTMDLLLREFYSPFVALRDRVPGYTVSLVKAAARLRGELVGPVRAPLVDPAGQDLVDLEQIMRHGLDLVGAEF